MPNNFGGDQLRLIACGWEIVNTTPVVNMSGSITAYRCPNSIVPSFINLNYSTTPAVFSYIPVTFGCLPPGTQSSASLFPNSRTWQTSEGLYQTACMNSPYQPFVSPVPGTVGFMDIPTLTSISTGYSPAWLPIGAYTTTTTAAHAQRSHMLNWDISGAVLTNQSSFAQNYQITVKYYFEKVPSTSDVNLLVLAHEPAAYDPLSIEIYSKAMAVLPVGVPVSENPLGEWFNQVMDTVASALPVIGTALSTFFPPAALIGTALGSGASAAARFNRQEMQKQQKDLQNIKNTQQQQAKDMKTLKTNTLLSVASNGKQATGRPTPKPLKQQPAPRRLKF